MEPMDDEVKLPTLPEEGELVAGRFRIVDLLGSGGFGTVYRAIQENVGRDVALKFLTPGVAKDPVNVERFRREAYHVSQLRHPNTITLYDYGQTEEGLIYMVMELLEGVSLADTVQDDGAIEWPRAGHIFIQVLKSLSEAHQRGLVHRDLKPENIFLCELFGEQDYVKVLDFGVAKMTMMDDEDESEAEAKLTKAGRIFGTPMYMAPEQACAEPITPATDVYALGLLIFEMLTGLPPVTGRNRMDVIHKQIRDEVPELTKELQGTHLGKFIRKATEKKPSARYLDAAEMLDAFILTLRAMKIQPRPRGEVRHEISITGLGPEVPIEEDSPTVQRAALKAGLVDAARVSPDATVDATDDDIEFELQEPEPEDKAKPPPLPPSVKPGRGKPTPMMGERAVKIAKGGLPERTVERRSLMSRMAKAEQTTQRPPPERPMTKPRYDVPLVGRESDVLELSDLVQTNVFSHTGYLVMVEGESGIGKSRVIGSLGSNLRNLGVEMAVGRCRKRSLPLEPIREAIADYWGVSHSERMQVDKTIRSDLAKSGQTTSMEIDFLVDFVRPRGNDETQVDPKSEKAASLFAQLERMLVQLSEKKPLVIAVEDVQNADGATLAFLEYFAVTLQTQQLPIVVVLTLRPEERHTNPNLNHTLRAMTTALGAQHRRYALKRLRGRDLSLLLDQILPLEQRLKERVGWLSQGVPLHAIQIVRYLQNEGSIENQDGRWVLLQGSPREMELPPDLMDLMRLRIEQATARREGSSLRATLEWLATLGMRTPIELLSAVIGGSDGLDTDLVELREQGIVRQAVHQNLDSVEFDNSLLREAILRDLSERHANRRLHKTAAARKIEFYRNKGMEIPLVEIAEHWRQAGERDKYRDTMFAAAQRSVMRQDLRGARDQFREVINLLEKSADFGEFWVQSELALADLAWRFGEFGLAEDHFHRAIDKGVTDDQTRGRALRGLGHLLVRQSRHSEALRHYETALEVAKRCGDRPGVAKALIGTSRVHLIRSDLRAEEEVRERLEKMLPELPRGEIAGKVLMHLAEAAQRRGELEKRRDFLVRARQEFETTRDRQGLSDALLSLGSALTDPSMDDPDRFEEADRVLKHALDLKKSLGDRYGVAEAYRLLGQLNIELNNYDEAESLLDQALSIHQALGTPFAIGAVHTAMGVLKQFRADYKASREHGERALEVFQRTGDQIAASHAMMNLGELAINRGDIPEAQRLLRDARRIKESMGSNWGFYDIRNHLAIVALWQGEFDEAEELLNETLEDVDEKGTGEDRAVARSLMGVLRCFQSRLQLAALELGRSRADAEDLGTHRVTVLCQANAAFYAGLTESNSTYEQLVALVKEERFFYTLERSVWLELVARLAAVTAEREPDRQAVRLLNTVAKFADAFGDTDKRDKLFQASKNLEAKVRR